MALNGKALAAVWHGVDEGFALTELPLPALEPGAVLVRTRLATLCGSDLHTITGKRPTPLPTVLGHEACGEIVATGGPVTALDDRILEPGMRVSWTIGTSCGSCRRCVRGLPQKCQHARKYGHEAITPSWTLNGGFATHCHLLPGTGIAIVPDGLPDVVAAPASCATATVAGALRRAGGCRGDVIVVQGCGMLGLTAIAYARWHGAAAVIGCDVSADRLTLAGLFGATAVTEPAGLAALVADLSGGEGADLVLEMSGHSLTTAIGVLAVGGRAVLAGSVFPGPEFTLDPESLVRRLITVTGTHNYTSGDLVAALRFLGEAADGDLFAQLVPARFGLDELGPAIRHALTDRPPRVALIPAHP